ncbi:RNA polymerase sigma factor [Cohnella mopanensis]|uniref:RNA polymerase sigma factor n=1 Tax=Cohnella mopanensis TaxID=2911966 RepID=UPI001EF8E5D9|nr:sigma-70 family RNA polymerase sigma factor [Cohnella mopanensis]
MPNRSDGELMRQIREGRSDALEQLYDRHARLVYSFAVRFSGNETLSREIVQLVYARLWSTKAEYDSGRGAFTSWLLTMTRNISIDVLRRERRHQGMVSIDQLNEMQGVADDPESIVLQSDQRRLIASTSRRLSEPQQRVIELLYWKGYTLQEIAEMGGEPVGTVKSRLHQALKTLRRHLQGLREEH